MITEKLQNAINDQIIAEMWSANLYLSMSFYLEKEGYDGFAHWMKKQSQEELEHAYDMASFLQKRGGTAKVSMIDVVPQGWGSVEALFKHVYEHECHVTALIDKIVDIAREDKDKPSEDFFMGYIREQVEEEATALSIYEKVQKAGEAGLVMLDSFGREAAGAAQGVVDEPLELAVDRAELVGGPFLQCFHRLSVYAEYETFGF